MEIIIIFLGEKILNGINMKGERLIITREICINKDFEIIEKRIIISNEYVNKRNFIRKIVDFLNNEYNTKDLDKEQFYVIGLSPDYQIAYVMQMKGEKTKVNIDLSQFLAFVWKTESKYIVCAHNHPNGVCEPSDEDIQSMLELDEICKQFNCIQLEDLIITKNGYYETIEDEERIY